MTKEILVEIIVSGINDVLAEDDNHYISDKVFIELDTDIFGKRGLLDSNGLVSLIVGIEETLSSDYDISVVIADERALSQERSPFRTVSSLTDYVFILVEEYYSNA